MSQQPAHGQPAAPVTAPRPAPVRAPMPLPGLLAGGNAAMSRFVSSLAREPAAPTATDEAEQRAVEAARAASPGPLMGMVRALAALGADRARLQPKLAAAPDVDQKKLGLAGRVLSVKDAPSTEAYVALGKELEAAGIEMPQRDEVYDYLGIAGLAAPSQIAAFAADLKGAMGWLAANKGFAARAAKLTGLVDARLAEVGVPRIMASDQGEAGHELGKFDRPTWGIIIAPELATLDVAADADKAMALFTTFYHEARHAEQDFHLIRLVIAEHPGERDAVATAPDDVILAAELAGPPTGADRQVAKAVRDSQYGASGEASDERRAQLRGELDELQARGASGEELKANYRKRWDNYSRRAHEADSFQTEKRLQSDLGWTPPPSMQP